MEWENERTPKKMTGMTKCGVPNRTMGFEHRGIPRGYQSGVIAGRASFFRLLRKGR